MKDLDISQIPAKFVYFWWLSRIIKHFDKLIISKEQVFIFGNGDKGWDLYRGHIILIRDEIGTRTMAEYQGRSIFGGAQPFVRMFIKLPKKLPKYRGRLIYITGI